EELQRQEISVWLDRHEISAGESIFERVNAGLETSRLGVLFLSPAYLNEESGWPRAEMNFFFQRRMRIRTPFIVYNIGIPHSSLPPVLRDYRYIRHGPAGIRELVQAIRRHVQRQPPTAG